MTTKLALPYGGSFDVDALIDHIRASGRNYIIQGQQAVTLSAHTKPHSLDYWLRQNGAANPDTKQAEHRVVDALVKTGLFSDARLVCPDSGRTCLGLRLNSTEAS